MGRFLLGFIIVLVITGVVGLCVERGLHYLSRRDRVGRAEARSLRSENIQMRALLNRISANNVGNPTLEAQLLLEKIDNNHLRELEK